MIALATIGRTLWSFLSFGITVPIGLFIAVWLFFQWDKSAAVKAAVVNLVAGAELEAARAREDGLAKINAVLIEDQRKLEAANMAFADSLAASETKLDKANEDIERILARPERIKCAVDRPVFDGLRNK